jgi:hypothetical protein
VNTVARRERPATFGVAAMQHLTPDSGYSLGLSHP